MLKIEVMQNNTEVQYPALLSTDRVWLPDGWLVRTFFRYGSYNESPSCQMLQHFVGDPNHNWKLNSEENHA